MMSSHVLGHVNHLGLLRHISWELTHALVISSRYPKRPSIQVLSSVRLSYVHVNTFTTYVADSECIIQPPTYGLGYNTDTPVPSVLSLKNPFQRKLPKTLVSKRSLTLWHTHGSQGNSLRPQGPMVVESQHHASPYNTFWGISNPSQVDVLIRNMVS